MTGENCYSLYHYSNTVKDYIFFGSKVDSIKYCFYKGNFYKASIVISN